MKQNYLISIWGVYCLEFLSSKRHWNLKNEDIVSAYCINQHRYTNIRIFYISQMVLHCALDVRYLEAIHFNVWFVRAKVLWIKHCVPCKAHRSIVKSSKNVQENTWCVIISHVSASNILFMCSCSSLYWTLKCLNGVNKQRKWSNCTELFINDMQ